jgi:ATPase subunit of ABC transporter with duplicated ATPase domains
LQVASLGNELSDQTSAAVWVERTPRYQNEAFEEQTNDERAELRILRERYTRNNSSLIPYDEFAKHDIMKRNNFHKTLIEKIKEQIQIAAQQPTTMNTVTDQNLKEVAQHILKCQENVLNVDESRQRTIDIQRSISTYLRADSKTPLVIHGTPGCGKSTMVSMAAKLASDNMVDGTTLVLRFLGSTRHSSNLRFVLRSVCFQLTRAFGSKDLIPEVSLISNSV